MSDLNSSSDSSVIKRVASVESAPFVTWPISAFCNGRETALMQSGQLQTNRTKNKKMTIDEIRGMRSLVDGDKLWRKAGVVVPTITNNKTDDGTERVGNSFVEDDEEETTPTPSYEVNDTTVAECEAMFMAELENSTEHTNWENSQLKKVYTFVRS